MKFEWGTLKLKNVRFLKNGEGSCPIDGDSINRVRSINSSWYNNIDLSPSLFAV
jgi:hypothetical protein